MKPRKKPAGRSISNGSVPNKDVGIKQELDDFKRELLLELAKIIGELQAAKLLGYQQVPQEQSITIPDDTPIYIPGTIGTGENIDVEIRVESKESNSSGLDDAAEALRKKKKENSND